MFKLIYISISVLFLAILGIYLLYQGLKKKDTKTLLREIHYRPIKTHNRYYDIAYGVFCLILVLIILNYSCGEKKDTSMFLFLPDSKKEILDNGYQKNQKLNYYEKVNGDTTETIGHWNDDTKVFTKHFYVKIPNKMSIAQKEEILNKLSDFILANSDTVYFNQLHSSLFKIQGRNLALRAGYSGNASYFSITMYTLNSPANKNLFTNYLEQLKTLNDKSINLDSINYAINLANKLR